MLKVASFDIVFQEVPGEVTLALNISGCPNRCPGCHSPHLREDIGEELNAELIDGLIAQYRSGITCVCFMGGDQAPDEVARLAAYVKTQGLKTAWYSGQTPTTREPLPASPQGEVNRWAEFDFVKVGPYVEALGGLKNPSTNQRFYRREGSAWIDDTARFQRKKL